MIGSVLPFRNSVKFFPTPYSFRPKNFIEKPTSSLWLNLFEFCPPSSGNTFTVSLYLFTDLNSSIYTFLISTLE